MGTGDGLNRYNGVGFNVYKPIVKGTGGITGRVIRNKITEDESDRLWLSTETGLQYLDKKTDRFQFLVPFGDTLNYMNGSLYPIQQIGENFWLGKTTEGILSYNLQSKRYTAYPFPGSARTPLKYLGEKVLYDRNGHLWSCQAAGLYCFNMESKKWTVFLENRKLSHSCLVHGTLYIIVPEGVLLFDIHDYSSRLIKTAQTGTNIRCIAKDSHNAVWAGDVYGNILKIDEPANRIITIGNINGINGASFPVYDLCFDESGILWIGTDGMGLLKANVHPPDFYKFPGNEQQEGSFIKSIYEDESGLIWLGTFGKGILQLNTITNAVTKMDMEPFKKPGGRLVSFMKEDQFRNLWIGYGDRLFCRKYNTTRFIEFKIPISGNRNRLAITGMANFKDQWLLSTTLGVFRLFITKNFKDTRIVSDPDMGNFSFIFSNGNDSYLFGYNEGGLLLFNEQNGEWKDKKHLVQKTGFKCVYKDTVRNLLWFGTDRGLMAYNPLNQQYRLFTEADGLANSFVYGILESGGQLWLSTNGGLCNITIGAKKDNTFPGISCRNYKQKDGLQADEFNTGAFLKSSNGTLFFGGINGVNWFKPTMICPDKKITKLAITQFTINNAPADPVVAPEYISSIRLNHTQNNLYLQFHALEFSNPANIHYSYKLSGWDKDWVDSKTNNEVRYNNLLPGNYTFYVRASNSDRSWMDKPHVINISIAPPFWKRWWFYGIELLFAAVFIIWITKVAAQWKLKKEIEKLEHQKALFAERMRIAQEMHDDIGAGLTQISLISESAKLHSVPGNNIENELEDISTTSRRLVDNIGEIIWSLNPHHNTLEILVAHLREQINKLMEYSDIDCSINFPDQLPVYELTNQQRRNILLVTKEIVHNTIKYSKAQSLLVNLVIQNNQLQFAVSDDGIGFDISCANKGNGLRNIRHRVNEVGGSIVIHSGQGKGTTYIYNFPLADPLAMI